MAAPFSTTPDSCAVNCIAITPSDSDLVAPVRALYIGGSGNVRINDTGGGSVIFYNVPAGVILPVMARRVWSTNTTASNIVGLL
jgi:hypothetical protein